MWSGFSVRRAGAFVILVVTYGYENASRLATGARLSWIAIPNITIAPRARSAIFPPIELPVHINPPVNSWRLCHDSF